MRFIAALVVSLLGVALMPAGQVTAAWEANPAVACSTVERGKGHVTRIEWASGETARVRNMKSRRTPFVGARVVLAQRSKPGQRVVKCYVARNGNVVLRTNGGARIDYYQPDLPPSTRPAAAFAPWSGPMTFHSTLSAEWRVAEAVAAWNEAMPADRQLSMQAEPCTTVTCISVTMRPLLSATRYGEAYQELGPDGQMARCDVGVAADVPLESRAWTVAHEIGHCLGLSHWDYDGSVMSPSPSEWTDLPSRYDLEWL